MKVDVNFNLDKKIKRKKVFLLIKNIIKRVNNI